MELLRSMDYYVLQDFIKKYSAVPDNGLALTHDTYIPTRGNVIHNLVIAQVYAERKVLCLSDGAQQTADLAALLTAFVCPYYMVLAIGEGCQDISSLKQLDKFMRVEKSLPGVTPEFAVTTLSHPMLPYTGPFRFEGSVVEAVCEMAGLIGQQKINTLASSDTRSKSPRSDALRVAKSRSNALIQAFETPIQQRDLRHWKNLTAKPFKLLMNSAGAVFMTIPTHVDVQNGGVVPEDPLASWKGSLQQIIDNCDIVIVNSAENTPATKGLVEMAVNKPVVVVKGRRTLSSTTSGKPNPLGS
jgi:hypothetical protein